MSGDRDLLERAAKAAGVAIEWADGDVARALVRPANAGALCEWNPLQDDGDALRLAVKLSLHLGLEESVANAWQANAYFDGWSTEVHNGDANAATRRAIVRAAAALWRPT